MAKTTNRSIDIARALGDEALASQVQGLLEAGGGCANPDRDPREHLRVLLSYSGKGSNRDVAFLKTETMQSPCLKGDVALCSLRSWFIESYGDRLIDVLMRLAGAARATEVGGGGGPEKRRQLSPEEWRQLSEEERDRRQISANEWDKWVWVDEDPDFPGMLAEHSVDVVARVSTGKPLEDGEDLSLEELADANLPPEIAAIGLPGDVTPADVVNLLTQQDAEARIAKAPAKERALGIAFANMYVESYGTPILTALGASSGKDHKDHWGLVALFTPAVLPIASALVEAGFDVSEMLDNPDHDDAPPALKDPEE